MLHVILEIVEGDGKLEQHTPRLDAHEVTQKTCEGTGNFSQTKQTKWVSEMCAFYLCADEMMDDRCW